MFNDALSMLNDSEERGYVEHSTRWVWEVQMSLLAKKNEDFWDYFNNL